MSSCCSSFCTTTERQFSDAVARRDLRRFRRRGPDATTRLLRDAILRAGAVESVLDVGTGIGALSLELLASGVPRAVAVDAASAYLAVAREEAARRNVAGRLELLHGDFVTVGPQIAPADVVAMNRVVCCYPAYEPLLKTALGRSRRFFAFSYPHNRWYVRAVVSLMNLARAAFRNHFRVFVHSAAGMHALIARCGFSAVSRHTTPVWAVEVWAKQVRNSECGM